MSSIHQSHKFQLLGFKSLFVVFFSVLFLAIHWRFFFLCRSLLFTKQFYAVLPSYFILFFSRIHTPLLLFCVWNRCLWLQFFPVLFCCNHQNIIWKSDSDLFIIFSKVSFPNIFIQLYLKFIRVFSFFFSFFSLQQFFFWISTFSYKVFVKSVFIYSPALTID